MKSIQQTQNTCENNPRKPLPVPVSLLHTPSLTHMLPGCVLWSACADKGLILIGASVKGFVMNTK